MRSMLERKGLFWFKFSRAIKQFSDLTENANSFGPVPVVRVSVLEAVAQTIEQDWQMDQELRAKVQRDNILRASRNNSS